MVKGETKSRKCCLSTCYHTQKGDKYITNQQRLYMGIIPLGQGRGSVLHIVTSDKDYHNKVCAYVAIQAFG